MQTASSTRPLTIVPVPGPGAEDVLVGQDGTVYTGTADGAVWAVSPDGASMRRVGTTGVENPNFSLAVTQPAPRVMRPCPRRPLPSPALCLHEDRSGVVLPRRKSFG